MVGAAAAAAVSDVVTDVAVAEVGVAPDVVDGATAIVAGSAASALFAERASIRANSVASPTVVTQLMARAPARAPRVA